MGAWLVVGPGPAPRPGAGRVHTGACIALQYGLDYPEEVSGLVLMTVAMRPKYRAAGSVDMRLQAAEEPAVYEQWIAAMQESMRFVAPELREHLIACHHQIGPRFPAS